MPIILTLLPQADADALTRSTAIHNRAMQLHDGVLGAFPSSGDTDIDLQNLCTCPGCFSELAQCMCGLQRECWLDGCCSEDPGCEHYCSCRQTNWSGAAAYC